MKKETVNNNNIDETEIKKFNQLASKWWDLNGEFKSLHKINPLRSNWIDSHTNVAEKQLLDVGCGAGILSESMAFRGADVTGIDMAESLLEIAKLHMLESNLNINYQKSTIEAFAEAHKESFDTITCMEMLEHVPNPSSIIKSCVSLLKPDGELFLSTINRNIKSYLGAILGGEYILNLLPKGTHEYEKLIKPSELCQWLRESNLEVIDLCGLTYNPINDKFSVSSNDVDINYMVYAKKI